MRQLAVAGLAVAISVCACLPFARTVVTSPPIVGVYRAETGEPISSVLLAISTDGDSLCSSPALLSSTDSTGAFSFPLTEQHIAVTVLVPFESLNDFAMCAKVAGAMRAAYQAHTGVGGHFSPVTISLTCIESRTPNTKPVVCTKQQ